MQVYNSLEQAYREMNRIIKAEQEQTSSSSISDEKKAKLRAALQKKFDQAYMRGKEEKVFSLDNIDWPEEPQNKDSGLEWSQYYMRLRAILHSEIDDTMIYIRDYTSANKDHRDERTLGSWFTNRMNNNYTRFLSYFDFIEKRQHIDAKIILEKIIVNGPKSFRKKYFPGLQIMEDRIQARKDGVYTELGEELEKAIANGLIPKKDRARFFTVRVMSDDAKFAAVERCYEGLKTAAKNIERLIRRDKVASSSIAPVGGIDLENIKIEGVASSVLVAPEGFDPADYESFSFEIKEIYKIKDLNEIL